MANPLTEVLPAKARLYVYAVVFVAGLAFAAWQAADGDWTQFAAGIIGALTSALAGGNTPREPKR